MNTDLRKFVKALRGVGVGLVRLAQLGIVTICLIVTTAKMADAAESFAVEDQRADFIGAGVVALVLLRHWLHELDILAKACSLRWSKGARIVLVALVIAFMLMGSIEQAH